MLQSKLSTKYPMKNPDGFLFGKDHTKIDPVFAKRLAAVCTMTLTEGLRSHETQKLYYAEAQEYKRTGIVGKHGIKSAAKEGTSYHEYGLAIDTSSEPIRSMTNDKLSKYGLCKPIKKEPWHIQPIETIDLGIDARKAKHLFPVEAEEYDVEDTKLIIKGKEVTVKAINVDGSNFVKLRDLESVLKIGYDASKNMATVDTK